MNLILDAPITRFQSDSIGKSNFCVERDPLITTEAFDRRGLGETLRQEILAASRQSAGN
jgi:hypothetical protein